MNSYDLDGVVYMGKEFGLGLRPSPDDIIITGRSFEEAKDTYLWLHSYGIFNPVFFNPRKYSDKTRKSSGFHKFLVINEFINNDCKITFHFEDDPIQAEVIESNLNSNTKVILIQHNLVEKENTRYVFE